MQRQTFGIRFSDCFWITEKRAVRTFLPLRTTLFYIYIIHLFCCSCLNLFIAEIQADIGTYHDDIWDVEPECKIQVL